MAIDKVGNNSINEFKLNITYDTASNKFTLDDNNKFTLGFENVVKNSQYIGYFMLPFTDFTYKGKGMPYVGLKSISVNDNFDKIFFRDANNIQFTIYSKDIPISYVYSSFITQSAFKYDTKKGYYIRDLNGTVLGNNYTSDHKLIIYHTHFQRLNKSFVDVN